MKTTYHRFFIRQSLTLLFLLSIMSLPLNSFAHVKWFVQSSNPVRPYSLSEPWVITWLIIAAAILALGWWNQRNGIVPKKLSKIGGQHLPFFVNLSMILIGLWPIFTLLKGHVLLPTAELHSTISLMGAVLLVTGITAMIPYTRKLSGIGFIGLWVYLVSQLGLLNALEHVFIIGIAIVALWLPVKVNEFTAKPLPLIRSLTGFSLVLLAFREKLLFPGLAQTFLMDHPQFNVLKLMGATWFDDRLFILSTGMIELLLGIMIMVGISTRLNTLFLGGAFITTAAALGPQEVLGHLPLFGIAVWLLVYGNDTPIFNNKNQLAGIPSRHTSGTIQH